MSGTAPERRVGCALVTGRGRHRLCRFGGVGAVGGDDTRLIVIRGNSGSGKSTIARSLQKRLGRETAWVEQDHFRRKVLREPDVENGLNIRLIDHTIRFLLDERRTVVLEGILDSGHYGAMLRWLTRDHVGVTIHLYLDVLFDETVRRHSTRPQAAEFTPDQMNDWYRAGDLLSGVPAQTVVPASHSASQVVEMVVATLER